VAPLKTTTNYGSSTSFTIDLIPKTLCATVISLHEKVEAEGLPELDVHPCLQILDIQENIFGHLTGSHASLGRTWASVARSCQAFFHFKSMHKHHVSHIAAVRSPLSLLWRDQAALGPLIQVMPLDLWTISSSRMRAYVVSAKLDDLALLPSLILRSELHPPA